MRCFRRCCERTFIELTAKSRWREAGREEIKLEFSRLRRSFRYLTPDGSPLSQRPQAVTFVGVIQKLSTGRATPIESEAVTEALLEVSGKKGRKDPKKVAKGELSASGGDALFRRVAAILDQARGNVVRSVNTNMVLAYWLIGREIVQAL